MDYQNNISVFHKISAKMASCSPAFGLTFLLLLVSPFLIIPSIRFINHAFALNELPANQMLNNSQFLIKALEEFKTDHGEYPPGSLGIYYEHYLNPEACQSCIFIRYQAYPSANQPEHYILSFRERGSFYRWQCYFSGSKSWSAALFKCPEPSPTDLSSN
jgi:hypothetical protein